MLSEKQDKTKAQHRVRENYNLIWDVPLLPLPIWKKNSAAGWGREGRRE
jgi:hypothetical protein